MPKTAAIYARQSTEDQSDYSLSEQIKECREYARKQNYQIVAEHSEFFTGTSLERPELNKIRDLAGRVDVLVVYNVDRLSRDPVDLLNFHKHLNVRGTLLDFVAENFDPTTDTGQFMLFLQGMYARNYRISMQDQMMRGKRGRASAGKVLIGSTPPYGYDYNRETGLLEINPEEAEIVRQIFQWYVYGDEQGRKLGQRHIANRLTEMKVPTKRDKQSGYTRTRDRGVWNRSTINRILKAEVCTGIWNFNRHGRKNGKLYDRPKDEWIPVQVPAIIERDLFEAAGNQSKKNFAQPRRPTKREYLMQGRLSCAKCGKHFVGQPGKGGYTYYLCGGQKADSSRDGKTKICHRVISVKQWDMLVWNAVKGMLLNPDTIVLSMNEQLEQSKKDLGAIYEYLKNCEKQLEELEVQESKLLELYIDSKFAKELLDQKLQEIRNKRSLLEEKQIEYKQRIEQKIVTQSDEDAIRRYCAMASEGIEYFTYEDKRVVLDILDIQGIVHRGDTRDEDVIVLSGFIPKTEDGIYSQLVTTARCSAHQCC